MRTEEGVRRMRMLGRGSLVVFTSAMLGAGALFIGCNGQTDGGKAASEDFTDTEFVANESTVGSLTLSADSSIPVASTGNFSVQVRDASGGPVRNIRIICDSEEGIAILEPTSATELTDSFGGMSGVIGCEAPGSYQFGCRLPSGGNLRKFVSVNCTGDVPDGFDGFEGSSGGSVGGGSVDDDFSLRITDITFTDAGTGVETTSVDVTRNSSCATTSEPEPWGDHSFEVDLVNDTESDLKVTSVTYSIPGVGTIGPVGLDTAKNVSSNGGEATITGRLADTLISGSSSSKVFHGSNTTITAIGFKQVTFTFTGKNSNGDTFEATTKVGINFVNVDNCDS